TRTPYVFTLSLPDALPFWERRRGLFDRARGQRRRHAVAGDDVMTARLGRIGPMWRSASRFFRAPASLRRLGVLVVRESRATLRRSEEHTSELQSREKIVCR